MIPTVAFIGHQESGKTTLLTRLLPVLQERGHHRVGVVKHAASETHLDQPGKDSALFQEAGAEKTLVISPSCGALFFKLSEETSLVEVLDSVFQGFDLVLVEGFKQGPFPKIEVYRRSSRVGPGAEPLAGTIDVIAVVTDERVALPDGVPLLSPHRLEEVVDFLEQTIL
jgi:molybdopterin-guanine dinucleotide biosynthesis protein MobB